MTSVIFYVCSQFWQRRHCLEHRPRNLSLVLITYVALRANKISQLLKRLQSENWVLRNKRCIPPQGACGALCRRLPPSTCRNRAKYSQLPIHARQRLREITFQPFQNVGKFCVVDVTRCILAENARGGRLHVTCIQGEWTCFSHGAQPMYSQSRHGPEYVC